MTDEELQQAIQEVSESLDNLPESSEKLPDRHRTVLLLRKETLQKIKQAREKDNRSQEIYNTAYYRVLTSWGEKHPFLVGLIMSHFRWTGYQ